jgi:AraC-like DNA-binding protein
MSLEAHAPSRDAAFEQFVLSSLPSDDARLVLQGVYTDAFHRVLLARLAGLRDDPTEAWPIKPLLPWRLKKVCAYIEENLERRLSLRQLAQVAGISRMYFAAQFRVATGHSPHEFVLQRRLIRAAALLEQSAEAIVDIALSVGFQTQPHFTTAFKRARGITPNKWRELHGPNARECAVEELVGQSGKTVALPPRDNAAQTPAF